VGSSAEIHKISQPAGSLLVKKITRHGEITRTCYSIDVDKSFVLVTYAEEEKEDQQEDEEEPQGPPAFTRYLGGHYADVMLFCRFEPTALTLADLQTASASVNAELPDDHWLKGERQAFAWVNCKTITDVYVTEERVDALVSRLDEPVRRRHEFDVYVGLVVDRIHRLPPFQTSLSALNEIVNAPYGISPAVVVDRLRVFRTVFQGCGSACDKFVNAVAHSSTYVVRERVRLCMSNIMTAGMSGHWDVVMSLIQNVKL